MDTATNVESQSHGSVPCCGSCAAFTNEGVDGKGWCQHLEMNVNCGDVCQDWTFGAEGEKHDL